MRILYQANDGKIFENEFNCMQHENGINKPLFEKSKFFTSFLDEKKIFNLESLLFMFILQSGKKCEFIFEQKTEHFESIAKWAFMSPRIWN